MKAAVVSFPGSNCDTDAVKALGAVCRSAQLLWHTVDDLSAYDLIVIPGGFSYGDYLRPGAIARVSPAVAATVRAAREGARVLGICNGFQILTEVGLLPGALLRNAHMQFRCELAELTVNNANTAFSTRFAPGERIRLPIAHGDGNYVLDDASLAELERDGRVVFRYVRGANPNGSVADIAGIVNETGNVLGLMPHPERATDKRLGSDDGARVFASILDAWRSHDAAG
jgi:phosphoribosylformylglycinamidine synthase